MTVSARRAASTSFLPRAPSTSPSAPRSRRRAPCAPRWPRRRPSSDVITPSAATTHRPSPRRLLGPTQRRRSLAEPQNRRSLVARRRPRRARAGRVVGPRVHRVSHTAERRPMSPFPASLLLSAHRHVGSTSPHDEGERALSRKRGVPPSSAAGITDGARSPLRLAPRALCWTRRRAPTDGITPSFVAALCPSPCRLHDPTRRRRASAEPQARRSSLERRRPYRWRVLAASSGAACAVLAAPPTSADQRHHAQPAATHRVSPRRLLDPT